MFLLIYEKLGKLIKDGYTEFVFSSNSDFESVARIAVISHKIKNSNITTKYTAKSNDDIEELQKAYNEVIIPVIKKHTISRRNRYIIDNSEYCIFYVNGRTSDAKQAIRFAKNLNKPYINLYELLSLS